MGASFLFSSLFDIGVQHDLFVTSHLYCCTRASTDGHIKLFDAQENPNFLSVYTVPTYLTGFICFYKMFREIC